MTWPNEHFAHEPAQWDTVVKPVTWMATLTSWAGILLALVMYGTGYINPAEVRKQFQPLYRFLLNKWWFDELYDLVFVRPSHGLARLTAAIDKRWIDGLVDGTARLTRRFAIAWDWFADRLIVDGSVNRFASWLFGVALWFRTFQTGRLRQYVMFIVIGTLAVFVVISFF
jgi:NADH-quinone oxidoreductase subunit L